MNTSVDTNTVTNSLAPSKAFTEKELKNLGLSINDVSEIDRVACSIDHEKPITISQFGRELADHTTEYADSLLDQVRNSDLNEAGDKLTQVVTIARQLNLDSLNSSRSRIPLLGPLFDRVRARKANFAAQFESTRTQIDSLVAEVHTTQSTIQDRNKGLELMYGTVVEEHRQLGIHIAAGRLKLTELAALEEDIAQSINNDPKDLQRLSDLRSVKANLDKRVGDLIVLQQSAMQSLPTIRMIQANNDMLVDKFHTIRAITVPTWKRQFMLAMTLDEQENAVTLAKEIDDTTNSLLKRNSELLHSNSVATAKANQRLVIDVETLKTVQDNLLKTVSEVIQIQRKGVEQRKEAEKKISDMRDAMKQRLLNDMGPNGSETLPKGQSTLH